MARRSKRVAETEKLARYKANISLAQRIMRPLHEDWKRYAKFYAGEQWDPDYSGVAPDNAVVVNQIGPVINTILPSMYTQPPKTRAKPLRPQDENTAPLVEAMLNYEWNRIGIDDELRLAGLDMLVFGNGWALVGYEYDEVLTDRDPDDIERDLMEATAAVQALAAGLPPSGAGLPPPPAAGGPPDSGPNPEELGGLPEPPDAELAQAVAPEQQQPNAGDLAGLPPGLAAMVAEERGGPPAEDAVAPETDLIGEGLPTAAPQGPPIDPALLPTEEELTAFIPTTEMAVLKDDIFVERVSVFDVFVDVEARTMKEARWVARRRVVDLEEVKSNPQYRNTKGLQGSMTAPAVEGLTERLETVPGIEGQYMGTDWTQRVELWEYYNLKDRTLCVFTLDHDRMLYEDAVALPFEGAPFVKLTDYVVPDSIWGYGEVKLIIDLQVELNRTRTQIINHNRRFNRKLLVDETAIDERGRAAIESPQDGVIIPVINSKPLKDVVLPVPDSPLPADRYQLAQMIESDITSITGISDYERGAYNNIRRTATEASIIQDASSLRQQDKLRRIEDAATEIGRRMKALAQAFYDRERWILVTGNGWSVPIRFSATDIQGEFDISVDAGSTQPQNAEVRKQEAERLFMLLGQNPIVNQLELVKHLLKAHGINAPDRFIDQAAVAMQSMQGMLGGMGGGGTTPPGQQPGQLGLPAPEEVQGGVQGGAQAAGVQ